MNNTPETASRTRTPNSRTRHATTPTTPARVAPLELAVTITPSERTPEWAALWRRLLRPLPTDPGTDTPIGESRGEAAGQ